jgi:hypothetical protein
MDRNVLIGQWSDHVTGPAWLWASCVAVIALAGLVVLAWQSRARAARRLDSALNGYAARQIAQEERQVAARR